MVDSPALLRQSSPFASNRRSFMSAPCQHGHPPEHPNRRQFLGASCAMTATAFLGTGTLSGIAYAAALTKAQREKLTPDEILAHMKKGNKRFYTGQRQNYDFLAQQRATAEGQHPAAVLLSCIDS